MECRFSSNAMNIKWNVKYLMFFFGWMRYQLRKKQKTFATMCLYPHKCRFPSTLFDWYLNQMIIYFYITSISYIGIIIHGVLAVHSVCLFDEKIVKYMYWYMYMMTKSISCFILNRIRRNLFFDIFLIQKVKTQSLNLWNLQAH